ncbi:MAG: hypothetical protein HC865_12625 [Cyanobacteria bacterium RU_5_0]|nr:hypothetical protein [Cyanobacteria bacterium RU_5_0]
MTNKLHSLFVTKNFQSAQSVYLDWKTFQLEAGLVDEVELRSCLVSNKKCWEILVTQQLHSERIKTLCGYDTTSPELLLESKELPWYFSV